MTKRFVDIEIGADIGQIRLYTTDEDYEAYDGEDILNLINELSKENKQLKQENQGWLKTASRMDTIHHEDRRYCERMYRENEKLKQENQQYKSLLRDMGC